MTSKTNYYKKTSVLISCQNEFLHALNFRTQLCKTRKYNTVLDQFMNAAARLGSGHLSHTLISPDELNYLLSHVFGTLKGCHSGNRLGLAKTNICITIIDYWLN